MFRVIQRWPQAARARRSTARAIQQPAAVARRPVSAPSPSPRSAPPARSPPPLRSRRRRRRHRRNRDTARRRRAMGTWPRHTVRRHTHRRHRRRRRVIAGDGHIRPPRQVVGGSGPQSDTRRPPRVVRTTPRRLARAPRAPRSGRRQAPRRPTADGEAARRRRGGARRRRTTETRTEREAARADVAAAARHTRGAPRMRASPLSAQVVRQRVLHGEDLVIGTIRIIVMIGRRARGGRSGRARVTAGAVRAVASEAEAREAEQRRPVAQVERHALSAQHVLQLGQPPEGRHHVI